MTDALRHELRVPTSWLVLCSLDLLRDKPERHYVLAQAIKDLIGTRVSPIARSYSAGELELMLQ